MRVEIPNQISVKIGGIISRGVKAVEVTDEGKLIFTLTDGSTVDLGSVIGPEGRDRTGRPSRTGGRKGRHRRSRRKYHVDRKVVPERDNIDLHDHNVGRADI